MKSWKKIPVNSDFTTANIPFGIFSTSRRSRRVGVAIGEEIIDVAALCNIGLIEDVEFDTNILLQSTLNDFISLGKQATTEVRRQIQQHLSDEQSPLREYPNLFIRQSNATMHLPVEIKDYTDFYSSMEHATNVGKMFRDPDNALLPNWKHLPVGYHGRASSIVVSGTNFHRPKGQILDADGNPVFGPTQRLDFELEMGFIVGKKSDLGQSISIDESDDYIFGLLLVNDWSARDIQKWEYVPLGPFLGKNFATSISPWVVTLEALVPFRIAGPTQDPPVMTYLQNQQPSNFNLNLEVMLSTEKQSTETVISKTNSRYLYWSMSQQLAHHTINGCNVNVGDLMASGTISGQTPDSYGSMLELSWGGKNKIKLKDGSDRTFLQDGDTVILRGSAGEDAARVGFGEVSGTVLPSI